MRSRESVFFQFLLRAFLVFLLSAGIFTFSSKKANACIVDCWGCGSPSCTGSSGCYAGYCAGDGESSQGGGNYNPPPPPPPPPPADNGGGGGCQSSNVCDCSPWLCGPPAEPEPPPCYPSCANSCGQGDGCGGSCGYSDTGAPGVPTLTSPTSTSNVLQTAADRKVTVSWTGTSLADVYDVEIYPQGTSCADPDATCAAVYGGSTTFIAENSLYTIRVRARNTTCGNDASAWSSFVDFTVLVPISGSVLYDPNNTANVSGTFCSSAATLSPKDFGNPPATVDNGQGHTNTQPVGANGLFTLYAPYWNPGNNLLRLGVEDNGIYTCTCPIGCQYSGVNSPASGIKLYVTDAQNPWFQVVGGSVAAYTKSGVAINNPISTLCTAPTCQPYMILNQSGDGTVGAVVTGGGSVDLEYTQGVQNQKVGQDGTNRIARVSRDVRQQNYDYFWRLFRFSNTPVSDFSAIAHNLTKPTQLPSNANVNAYYQQGDVTIQQAWQVSNGESIVIFVDGNLSLKNTIGVEQGGFLAFIVSGDITIDADLGLDDPTDTDTQIAGVYVANGQIILPSRGKEAGGDKKFVGEGTFVGWQGVVLERDYSDTLLRRRLNNENPVELFKYRPDFVLRAPVEMRSAYHQWQEVNP